MLAVDMPMLRPALPITPPSCPKRPGFCNPARRKQLKLHYRPKVPIIHPVKAKPKVETDTEVFSLTPDEFDYSDQILAYNKLKLKYSFNAWREAKIRKEEEDRKKKTMARNTYLKSDDDEDEEDEDSVLFQLQISDGDEDDDDDDDKLISTCPQPLSTPTKSSPPPKGFSSPNSPIKVRPAFK